MNKTFSKYISTEDLNITYYLGAGASYNSIPILNAQGNSMIELASQINNRVVNIDVSSRVIPIIQQNEFLLKLVDKMTYFGEQAITFGSLDIFAKKLDLLGDYKELNNLKFCLSVYFDLWERFIYKGQKISNNIRFTQIDKRYLSLLSVLLNKTNGLPELNKNIKFLTWNYDLQLEMAYNSFLKENNNSLHKINSGLKFMDDKTDELNVYHLNGFRGAYRKNEKYIELIDSSKDLTLDEYLLSLIEIGEDFDSKKIVFEDSIKYAWEHDSASVERAKKVMKKTNILIIIGYSFPSFNRELDTQLIQEFEKNDVTRVIYQDPNANNDIVDSIFSDPKSVHIINDDISQFPIPQEFLFPRPAENQYHAPL